GGGGGRRASRARLPIELLARQHQLALGARDVVFGAATVAGAAAVTFEAVALAPLDGGIRGRCVDARDQLAVIETHQNLAGADLVVETDENFGNAACGLRADTYLAADRLDA